ncbi:DUF563 domain-containing protein [Paracoccus sp. SCSIO 75233]|uniref:glycosyltransferase family 61 protein n=1 Tax=Paracoccus sp. SCSIO 75233 TaxID=3017782 RepID=UPI0022EFF864|nr:glycosyltransferase 61 family protein [Paracoccus sp. SCSIO 75233]WBU52786.1 glycosyltransferase 61 family protein [Paracoccus sp. SCSIO 75233]
MQLYKFSRHSGVRLLSPPKNLAEPVLLGNIVAHNLVTNDRRRDALTTHMSEYFWHRRMLAGFSLKSIPAEVSNPGFKRGFLASDGRILLNGAAGDRARNMIRRALDYSEESIEFFAKHFAERADPDSVPVGDSTARQVWIEAKNYFNFFHFLTESLHKISVSDDILRQAEKILLFSRDNEVKGFVNNWIAATARPGCPAPVALNVGQAKPDGPIITPFSAKHLLYQFDGAHHLQIEDVHPAGWTWQGYDARPHPVTTLALNSFDESLAAFRHQMIALARRTVKKQWGKKIYVARAPNNSRKREMRGEERLISALTERGFKRVYFEELSPLEQVKCMSGARCVVMQHGAGMANMLFVPENAHVFELGTYQTAMGRWGDFITISHVPGCHYHHVFLDMDYEHEDEDPVFVRDGLIAPVISDTDLDNILNLVADALRDKRPGRTAGWIAHADYFVSREAYRQTYRLLDVVRPHAEGAHEYWETRAKVNEACGHIGAARTNLLKSWEIAQSATAKRNFLRLTDDSDERRQLFA